MDQTTVHRVDVDAVRREFHCHVSHPRLDRGLHRAQRGVRRVGADRAVGRQGDDPPAVVHQPDGFLRSEYEGPHIHRVGTIEVVRTQVDDVLEGAGRRVRHKVVQTPAALRHPVEKCADAVRGLHVRLNGETPAAGLLDVGYGLLRQVGVLFVVDHHGVAPAAEGERQCPADAARGACDQRDRRCPGFRCPAAVVGQRSPSPATVPCRSSSRNTTAFCTSLVPSSKRCARASR